MNLKNLNKYYFQTILVPPCFPNSFFKQKFGFEKFFLIKKEKEFKKIKFNNFLVLKIETDIYSLPPLLTLTERFFEMHYPNLKLILIFDQNIKTERIFNHLKDSYFLKRIIYLPWTLAGNKFPLPSLFFNRLNENQQLILQQIVQGSFSPFLFDPSEIEYLLKTGIINHQYQILVPSLHSFIAKKFSFFITNPSPFLSTLQKRGFNILLKNCGKIVSRENLAFAVWGKNFVYSDWSLDQFICRLRKKLKIFLPQSSLLTIKKRGFIFLPSKIHWQKTFKKGILEIKPLIPSPKLVNFYRLYFQNPPKRKELFRFVYKNESQIYVWLNNLVSNPAFSYFSIFVHHHLVGHIGLKYINYHKKTATIGTFIKNIVYLRKYGVEIYNFILSYAKKIKLKLLIKDVSQYPSYTNNILQSLNFCHLYGSVWQKKL